jgi:hypothetical protein
MIASNCDFESFVNAVRKKDRLDIIYLAEQEATEAWRQAHRKPEANDMFKYHTYQNKLLGLIKFMRHGIKTADLTDSDFLMLTIMQDQIEARKSKWLSA